jgi:predicted DNA-binding protein
MQKLQVYLPKEEWDALRRAAKRSGRSVSALVREAIRSAEMAEQGITEDDLRELIEKLENRSSKH